MPTGQTTANSGTQEAVDVALSESGVDFGATVLRAEDQLALSFLFVNMRLLSSGAGAPQAVPKGDAPAYIIVDFQPQHIFEEVLQEQPQSPLKKPVAALLA